MEHDEIRSDTVSLEIIDVFTWEKSNKIITQDVHHIPSLGNFAHFSSVASQPPTPPHIHANFMELHCVVKGRRYSQIHINDDEIIKYTTTGNQSITFFPGEVHSSGQSAQDPYESFALQLNIGAHDDFLGLNPEFGRLLCERLSSIDNRCKRIDPSGLRLLKTAFQLLSVGERESGLAHIICFLFEFVSMPQLEEGLRQPIDSRIRESLEYIKANITEPIALEDLASLTGYSLSRFKSKFREETGHTPASFINASKVEEAKRLILSSDMSITQVALNLGWSSSNYFCSVFKKLTGISPLKYKLQARKKT